MVSFRVGLAPQLGRHSARVYVTVWVQYFNAGGDRCFPVKFYSRRLLQVLRRRFGLVARAVRDRVGVDAVYSRYLPDIFRSDTLILVVPQQVPESTSGHTPGPPGSRNFLPPISQQILAAGRGRADHPGLRSMRSSGAPGSGRHRRGDAQGHRHPGHQGRCVPCQLHRPGSEDGHESDRPPGVAVHRRESPRCAKSCGRHEPRFLERSSRTGRRLVETRSAGELPTAVCGTTASQLEANLQAVANTQMQIRGGRRVGGIGTATAACCSSGSCWR